jgi:hypothetical protein
VLIALRFRVRRSSSAPWFATFAAMFSVVAGMHQFYTASLSIPVALLIGTAFAIARRRRVLWAQLALPLTAATTALAISLSIERARTRPGGARAVRRRDRRRALILWDARRGVRRTLTAVVATVALILTPAVWSVVTVGARTRPIRSRRRIGERIVGSRRGAPVSAGGHGRRRVIRRSRNAGRVANARDTAWPATGSAGHDAPGRRGRLDRCVRWVARGGAAVVARWRDDLLATRARGSELSGRDVRARSRRHRSSSIRR